MKYGYARVSTTDQDLTIQVEALTNAGCETIRQEQVSGTSVQGRDELNTLSSCEMVTSWWLQGLTD